MIADKIKNIGNYEQLKKYEKDVNSFLKRLESENLPDGRYDIDGDNIFALVQRYTTKPKSEGLMEAHEKYADLQCILKGREYIYVDYAEDLKITDDRRPEGDIFFFELRPDKGGSLLEAGCFGYYAPTDAHMPCITADEPSEIEKVVFKILV